MHLSKRRKIVILVFVALAIVLILLNPLRFDSPKFKKFSPTPNPREAFEKAYTGNKPVFLEFYADW